MPFLSVYGHIAVDTILYASGREVLDDYYVGLGGTGANIARGASCLGVPAALFSSVGDDFPNGLRDPFLLRHFFLQSISHNARFTPA